MSHVHEVYYCVSLQVVVQEPGQTFKPLLPSILSLCMEQVYPIVAEVRPVHTVNTKQTKQQTQTTHKLFTSNKQCVCVCVSVSVCVCLSVCVCVCVCLCWLGVLVHNIIVFFYAFCTLYISLK